MQDSTLACAKLTLCDDDETARVCTGEDDVCLLLFFLERKKEKKYLANNAVNKSAIRKKPLNDFDDFSCAEN